MSRISCECYFTNLEIGKRCALFTKPITVMRWNVDGEGSILSWCLYICFSSQTTPVSKSQYGTLHTVLQPALPRTLASLGVWWKCPSPGRVAPISQEHLHDKSSHTKSPSSSFLSSSSVLAHYFPNTQCLLFDVLTLMTNPVLSLL